MTKLNITSKMLLWALFPIICFAIAIAATKWYCDTVKEDIPSELIQNNTPLNWQNVSFENLPAELKTQINPKRNLFYRVADASYSFPNLKNKIAENNPNFKIYSYLVYKKNDNFRKLESQWIYYNNNGMWVLENIPYNPHPDFEATAIQIVWFLSFGICLIAFIILFIHFVINDGDGPFLSAALICITLILTGFPFAAWFFSDKSVSSAFSIVNYPEWILVALILCEIAVLALVYEIYSSKLEQIDDKKNQENKLTVQIEGHKPSYLERHKSIYLDENILGRFYQSHAADENNRMEIIINEDFMFIKENNKWDKYTYEVSATEYEISATEYETVLFINRNNEYMSVVARGYYSDSKDAKLTFNGLSFSRTLVKNEPKDKDSEKSWIKTYLKIEIVEELHKPNIIKRIFTKRSCLEKKEQIEELFDECFDSIYESEIEKGFEKYNDPIYGQEYSESNIPQEFEVEIKKKIINHIETELKNNTE